jgi:predicted sulfurtransferase
MTDEVEKIWKEGGEHVLFGHLHGGIVRYNEKLGQDSW